MVLAVALPLGLWLAVNGAFAVFAASDLAPPVLETPGPVPADQPLLTAATALVRSTPCVPAGSTIQDQPDYAAAQWSALRSTADPHAYYVAATDPVTARLLGVWHVEGGQVLRLQDDRCTGVPAGSLSRLAEAAVLFSVQQSGN